MKNIFTALIVIAIGIGVSIPVHAQQQKKKTIAVLNFVNSGGMDQNEISILTNRFNNYLVTSGAYEVLERQKMEEILKEQEFSMSDNCSSSECAVQVGKLLSVECMVAGEVGKFGQMYTIDLRLIDVTSGKLLSTKSENYKGEKEGLLGIIEGMAYTISGKTAPVKMTTTTMSTGGEQLTGKSTSDDDDETKIGTVTMKFGSLELNCEMNGILYINDKQIGEVTEGSIIPIEKLKVGEYTIKIVYSEGEFTEPVKIEYNQKAKLTASKSSGSTFKDPRDGKVYKTVKIGNQVWMAENLNYDAGSGSWCYDNSSSNCTKYGRLYDWKTAKRLAPPGWHLPSKSEFETLLRNLGSEGADAYKQIIPSGSSGFNAMFGGWRYDPGIFYYIGSGAYFWSSTDYDRNKAWGLGVGSYTQKAGMRGNDRSNAFSVRLLKD